MYTMLVPTTFSDNNFVQTCHDSPDGTDLTFTKTREPDHEVIHWKLNGTAPVLTERGAP